MHFFKRINWINTSFLISTPLIALIGTIYIAATGQFHLATLVLALVLAIAVGIAITAGYHRLFSHKSFKAPWPIRLVLALIGALAFEGSILEWSTDHRNHHRYTDTEKDPYNIQEGFWWAHIGWLFMLDTSKRDFSNVKDLLEDPIVRFQHRFFVPLALLGGFGLPIAIASLWGDALGGFVIAGALRVVFSHHTTFFINSICHMFGSRPYSDRQSARDNWVTAIFTFGEGYHNYHHQFPLDYRNGIRFYQFDPAKWLIWMLHKLGLAYDLKRVSEHRILQYQIRMDEKRLMARVQNQTGSMANYVTGLVKPVGEAISQLLTRIDKLEADYAKLKKEKVAAVKASMHDKAEQYKQRLSELHESINSARLELDESLEKWRDLVERRFQKYQASS